ncbi:DUF7344 domain-containing protein [Halorussus caseinilyticus]|uniref:DUF7344 domain-containing protein n=1 Tax=Halorussus caseinilyticus TaxID=3034025 RepID=A0ABD5WH46_9EURY|nr:hypothetical protein [Halorussus sp. DT72]
MNRSRRDSADLSNSAPDDADRPLPDDLHWVLTDRRRRAALDHLREHGSATVAELTDTIAGSVDQHPERLRVSLDRHHLPVMDEAGLLDRNESERVVLADLTAETCERIDHSVERFEDDES